MMPRMCLAKRPTIGNIISCVFHYSNRHWISFALAWNLWNNNTFWLTKSFTIFFIVVVAFCHKYIQVVVFFMHILKCVHSTWTRDEILIIFQQYGYKRFLIIFLHYNLTLIANEWTNHKLRLSNQGSNIKVAFYEFFLHQIFIKKERMGSNSKLTWLSSFNSSSYPLK